MSQGRTQTNDGAGSKAHEPRGDAHQSPQVEIERLTSNDQQTVILFSGLGVDGAALALPDPDVDLEEAHEIAHDVIEAAGGVA